MNIEKDYKDMNLIELVDELRVITDDLQVSGLGIRILQEFNRDRLKQGEEEGVLFNLQSFHYEFLYGNLKLLELVCSFLSSKVFENL